MIKLILYQYNINPDTEEAQIRFFQLEDCQNVQIRLGNSWQAPFAHRKAVLKRVRLKICFKVRFLRFEVSKFSSRISLRTYLKPEDELLSSCYSRLLCRFSGCSRNACIKCKSRPWLISIGRRFWLAWRKWAQSSENYKLGHHKQQLIRQSLMSPTTVPAAVSTKFEFYVNNQQSF